MSCLRLHSRTSVPTAPRKYLVVTIVEALTDQKSGNSTPRCSKTASPVFQFVWTTSRRSQVISSYGCTPSVLKTRSIFSPLLLRVRADPLTVSVMNCSCPLILASLPSALLNCCACCCFTPGAGEALNLVCPARRFPTTHRAVCGSARLSGLKWYAGRGRRLVRHLPRRYVGGGRCLHGPLGPEHRDLLLERIGALEGLVDAREAEVGHLVELAQRPEDREAHLVGRNLGPALGAQRGLDLLTQAGEVVLGDRAALAGLPHPGDRLVAGERLGRSGALEHHELHLLDGAEPLLAGRARPPSADRAAVLGDPAVEHTSVAVAAVRTVHLSPLLPLVSIGPSDPVRAYKFNTRHRQFLPLQEGPGQGLGPGFLCCVGPGSGAGSLWGKLWMTWGQIAVACVLLSTTCGKLHRCDY